MRLTPLLLLLPLFIPIAWADDFELIPIADYQRVTEKVRALPSNDVSNTIRNLFISFSDDYRLQTYQDFNVTQSKNFLQKIAIFAYVAQSFQVKQEDIADIKTIREYIATAIKLKRKFRESVDDPTPEFDYLIDILKSVFISYVLDESQLRQANILYKSIRVRAEKYPNETHSNINNLYNQLLANTELKIIQGEIINQQYGKLTILNQRIQERSRNNPDDIFINSLKLSSALVLLEYRVTTHPVKVATIKEANKKIVTLYHALTKTSSINSSDKLNAIRAHNVIIGLLTPDSTEKDEILSKMKSISDSSISCANRDPNCLLILTTEARALLLQISNRNNPLSESKQSTIYQNYLERIKELASRSQNNQQLLSTQAFAIYQYLSLLLTTKNLDYQVTSLRLLDEISTIYTQNPLKEIAAIELRASLALAKRMSQDDKDYSIIKSLLLRTQILEANHGKDRNLLLERLRLLLNLTSIWSHSGKYQRALSLIPELARYHESLSGDPYSLAKIAHGYYNILLSSFTQNNQNQQSYCKKCIEAIVKIRTSDEANKSTYLIESKARLATINFLLSTKQISEGSMSAILAGFKGLNLTQQELLARIEINKRCVSCSKGFLSENSDRINALNKNK